MKSLLTGLFLFGVTYAYAQNSTTYTKKNPGSKVQVTTTITPKKPLLEEIQEIQAQVDALKQDPSQEALLQKYLQVLNKKKAEYDAIEEKKKRLGID